MRKNSSRNKKLVPTSIFELFLYVVDSLMAYNLWKFEIDSSNIEASFEIDSSKIEALVSLKI